MMNINNQKIFSPKKKFGQNFLHNEEILTKIVQTIPNNNCNIVEIGSGLGDLTKYLLQLKEVTSFEIDTDLKSHLRTKFKNEIIQNKLNLIFEDVLNIWMSSHLVNFNYNLVANLPYYVATHIILKALKDSHCQTITVMIQQEVAKRFCAKNGDRNFCSLSILANSIGNTEIVLEVGKEHFNPPPKVTSSVIRIVKFKAVEDIFLKKDFEDFLKLCFGAPRKTLAKNLSRDTALTKENILSFLEKCEIPITHRPHQTEIHKFHLLYKTIKAYYNASTKEHSRNNKKI